MADIHKYSSNMALNILQDMMNEFSSLASMSPTETNVLINCNDQFNHRNVTSVDSFAQNFVQQSNQGITYKDVENNNKSTTVLGTSQNDVDNVLIESCREISHELTDKIMKNVINSFDACYESNSSYNQQFFCDKDLQVTENSEQGKGCLLSHNKIEESVVNHVGQNTQCAQEYSLKANCTSLTSYKESAITNTLKDNSKVSVMTLEKYNYSCGNELIQSDILCEYASKASFRIMEDVFNKLYRCNFSSCSHKPKISLTNTSQKCKQVPHYPAIEDTDAVALSDTYLYSIFTSDDSKTKGKVHKTKSKRLKKQERNKRKLLKQLGQQEVPTFEDMGFWTNNEILYDEDDVYRCPVCFELYYNPYYCMPCEHSFCEPCLRRLAKYNCDNKRHSTCPICREPISYCQPNQVLISQISSLYPTEYLRRQKADGFNKYMRHPLPSKASVISLKNIARVVSERNRIRPPNRHRINRGARESELPQLHWRLIVFLILCLICKACIVVGIIWIYHYFAKEERITSLNGVWNYMIDHIWNYRELNEEAQARVSNLFVIIFIVLFLFGVLVNVSNRRFGFVQRL